MNSAPVRIWNSSRKSHPLCLHWSKWPHQGAQITAAYICHLQVSLQASDSTAVMKLHGRYRSSKFSNLKGWWARGQQKDLGPRGHNSKALFMDHPQNGGLRNGMVTISVNSRMPHHPKHGPSWDRPASWVGVKIIHGFKFYWVKLNTFLLALLWHCTLLLWGHCYYGKLHLGDWAWPMSLAI